MRMLFNRKKIIGRLDKFLNNSKTEKFIIVLILLNILCYILSTVDEIEFVTESFFTYFDIVCVAIFSLEFILRVITCKSLKQLFSPMMIIDFIAIAPFYCGQLFDNSTIFLRVVRISRLLRLAKLARYSRALKNIQNSFKEKKEELVITLAFFCISVIICGILMYLFEHNAQPDVFSSIPRSCYFAIVTFTTVGYGDFSPVTEEGRFIASLMAVLGACIHGLVIGVISAAISSALKVNK